MSRYAYAEDYLTPTRSQYMRGRSLAPSYPSSPVTARRSTTPPIGYRSMYNASPYTAYVSAMHPRKADPASPPSPTSPRAYAAQDSTPTTPQSAYARRSAYEAGSPTTPTYAAWNERSPRDAGSPRTPGYEASPLSLSAAAPPRPRLAERVEHPPASRWQPSHPAPAPHAPPSRYALRESSQATAYHAAPSAARRRSPSMVKEFGAAFLPPAHPSAAHRLCLVLDLDETLVYARDGPVHVRPFARELLRALHDVDVEVVVWTAGERDYAQSVIAMIDPLNTIQHCVYRHPKWWSGRPGYSKNLRALGRNLSRTLLVDNTPDCLRDQPDNGLLVSDFEGPRSYDDCMRTLLRVATALAERPHESVPRILADCADVVRRTVPLDAGGVISTWTLANDQVLECSTYQSMRYNRDSPQRARSMGRW